MRICHWQVSRIDFPRRRIGRQPPKPGHRPEKRTVAMGHNLDEEHKERRAAYLAATNGLPADWHASDPRFRAVAERAHREFYAWLGAAIGLTPDMLPKRRDIMTDVRDALAHGDKSLNSIPLHLWDRCDGMVRSAAVRAGMRSWSLSDTVCVLKEYARGLAEKTGGAHADS